jgi:hypothetical protein|tara:strand:- start:227 stop:562 length:336 start_codon:yes stop_codon:yes gene_type:complete
MTRVDGSQMTDKPSEKVELKVVLEPQDSTSKYILVALILVLTGLLFAIIASGGADNLLLSKSSSDTGNCGDGIDNDKGGKADRDDPDCYANPTTFDGYDASRTEANRDNDL